MNRSTLFCTEDVPVLKVCVRGGSMLSTTEGVRSKTYLAKRWLIAIIFATLVFAGIGAAVSYNSQKALADNNSASASATQISITISST